MPLEGAAGGCRWRVLLERCVPLELACRYRVPLQGAAVRVAYAFRGAA